MFSRPRTVDAALALLGEPNTVVLSGGTDFYPQRLNRSRVGLEPEHIVDIGAIDADGNAIGIERKRITAEESSFTIVVDKRPAKAGIDPLNKLIDRKPGDNTIVVTVATAQ